MLNTFLCFGATLALGIIVGGWLSMPKENKFSGTILRTNSTD
jgi:hypothetical protein